MGATRTPIASSTLEQHLLAGEHRLALLKDHLAFLPTIEVAATCLPR
jgi:hypothetical protein